VPGIVENKTWSNDERTGSIAKVPDLCLERELHCFDGQPTLFPSRSLAKIESLSEELPKTDELQSPENDLINTRL